MFVGSIDAKPEPVAAIGVIAAGIDQLGAANFDTADATATASLIAGLERECRRLQAAQVELLAAVERSGIHSADGHFSAKIMVRHHAQLSGPEAAQRLRVHRALRDLPEIADAYRAGDVGTCQIRLIAKVWANPRVRAALALCEHEFLIAATNLEYPDLDLFCRDWVEAVDTDGAHSNAERQWNRRDIRLPQDFNGSWKLDGRLTSIDGARFHEILASITDAEHLADIAAAQAEHGDDWRNHLARTPSQLRYDAFIKLVLSPPSGSAAAGLVTNIVIDQQTFDEQLAALCGSEPEPVMPDEIAKAILGGARYCHTADGTWVNPSEVVAEAVAGHVRRVVINSRGVITDVGRRQRLFSGSPRLAAMLQSVRCYWHGCWAPASKCDIDHLIPHREGGPTTCENGRSACRFHNLLKESGYQTLRKPDGTIEIIRPDGVPVPAHTSQWQQARAG